MGRGVLMSRMMPKALENQSKVLQSNSIFFVLDQHLKAGGPLYFLKHFASLVIFVLIFLRKDVKILKKTENPNFYQGAACKAPVHYTLLHNTHLGINFAL